MKKTKKQARKRIHYRIRKRIKGTAQRPRLCVFRSNKAIYCQAIDDVSGTTLAAASTKDIEVADGQNKTDQAKAVGSELAKRAMAKDISNMVFDRNGYLYHGRVKALAEGAREGGLKL
ncbi:MAG: 50S ribosomal protein L18 [Bacteroidota bacterium]